MALAQKIELAGAGRVGNNQYQQKVAPPMLAEAKPGAESRTIAAEAVGMKKETLRKAEKVIESGDKEVIQQMDSGEKSINAAYSPNSAAALFWNSEPSRI